MRLLRLMLVLVLSMTIPLHGMAAVPDCACPMQTQDGASAMDSAMSADMSDCCVPADSGSTPDKPCKPGQSCGVSGVLLALPAHFHFAAPVGRMVPVHQTVARLVEPASGIWRPPSLS